MCYLGLWEIKNDRKTQDGRLDASIYAMETGAKWQT